MVLFFRETDLDRVGQEGTKKEGGGGGKAVRCYKMCPSPPSLSPSSLPLRSGLWPLGIESQTKTLMGPQLIAVWKEREGGGKSDDAAANLPLLALLFSRKRKEETFCPACAYVSDFIPWQHSS